MNQAANTSTFPSLGRLLLGRTHGPVLAVASGGGHLVQLLRIADAFGDLPVHYVSTDPEIRNRVPDHACSVITDANRDTKLRLLRQIFELVRLIVKLQPRYVVTTGASCGYLAVRIAGLLGARTLFIDSVANAEQLSLSGTLACGTADIVWTQWPHLAAQNPTDMPRYAGSVI